MKQMSTGTGSLTAIGATPSVTVSNAADGSGTAVITPVTVLAGTTHTEALTFTTPAGGMTNGAVSMDVPAGWTPPQKTTNNAAGYTTATAAGIERSGRQHRDQRRGPLDGHDQQPQLERRPVGRHHLRRRQLERAWRRNSDDQHRRGYLDE